MKGHFTYGGYAVCSVYERAKAVRLLDRVWQGTLTVKQRFKDNPRNYIVRASFEGDELIVKIPRARNTRLQERFMTWFRPGEAERRYTSMQQLESLGFACTPPILAAERRWLGMVTDNILVYGYVDGRLAGPGDEEALASVLLPFYAKGYLRRDCKPSNFVIAPETGAVCFIDFRLTRPRILRRFRVWMELNQFLRNMPTARALIRPQGYGGWGFAVAGWCSHLGYRLNNYRRRLSRWLRGKSDTHTQ